MKEIWKYTHNDVKKWAKENIKDFKQNPLFYTIMGEIKKNPDFAYTKRLDNQNAKSAAKTFYTDNALAYLREQYLKRANIQN